MYALLFRSIFNIGPIKSRYSRKFWLGVIDYKTLVEAVKSIKTNKRKYCHPQTEKEQYGIGKYAAENGYAPATRKLKEKLLNKSPLKDL